MVADRANMKRICQASLLSLGLVVWSGCSRPVVWSHTHYSVAVAQGPTHTTFAQRNPHLKDDYLVDCKNNSDGTVYDCYVVKLPPN